MKKNIMKKSIAWVCAFILSMAATGCFNSSNSSGSSNSAVEENVGYNIWTTYNTTKVLRDVELSGDYVKMDKGIHVKMAKGEGEMGSLYITTGTDGIDRFDLVPQTLTNENGDEFSIEQMEVMAQRYIEISLKSRGNYLEEFPLGSYAPDAIVGMDLYKKAKENKIAPNSNQGITVDFKTTADTPAGVYTGTFQLGDLLTGLLLLGVSVLYFLLVTDFLAEQGDGVMTYRYANFMYDGSDSLLTVVKAQERKI